MDAARLLPPFSELKQALRADGADLVIEGLTESEATVRLVLDADACLECIMPKEALEAILFTSLRMSNPTVTRVNLIDPRIQSKPAE